LRDNPFGVVDVVGGRNRFLLKLGKGNHEEFHWLDITSFNLAYWQGHAISHTFTISSHVPLPDAPTKPGSASVGIKGDDAALCWEASPSIGVNGYRLYRAASPTYAYEQVGSQLTTLCYTDTYGNSNRVYAVTATDGNGQESGFSNFVWAPRLINPHAVDITSNGTRVILDPQNGYALLRQRSDGRYIQNFGSEHYHLEFSRFFAIDEQDHLIFSHPGDFYTGRHSVRVADRDANPILEFGERGSGNGQFETPAGVVAWVEPYSTEGPHVADAHTLLLLHFDDTYDGVQGEQGNPVGTIFVTGKYGQGVAIDSTDTLTYPTVGNLNRTQGAIEFWIRPNWNGGDDQSYTFFEVGNGWFNRMRIMKDGANNLRFMLWDSATEYGAGYNVAYWQIGEWHHVAATWQGSNIALFVDGQQRADNHAAHPPDVLADTIYIGSSFGHDQQANAAIDELRISDISRVGNSDTSSYRILVADSGNNRIQAFDESGNFVSAYGSLGSGSGQFNNPQGLAVDSTGRIIVADSGNNRLQLLGFDGSNLAFAQSITASFNQPMGVAAYGTDRIIVADTGNNQIKVLNSAGNLLAVYDAPNDGHSCAFNQPHGVVADNNGNILVADTGNRQVVMIRNESATVYVVPGSRDVNLRTTYTMAIAVENAVDLGGFEFDLTFDPALLQVDDVGLGNFLGSTGRVTGELGPAIDNNVGTATYGAFSFGSQSGPSGAGTLAVVTFTTFITPGTSALNVQNVQLSNTNAQTLPLDVISGSVTILGIFGDLDHDCDVDVYDIMVVVAHWNSHAGSPDYDIQYDFDSDGDIDVMDVMKVAAVWGSTCSGLTSVHQTSAAHISQEGADIFFNPSVAEVHPGIPFTMNVVITRTTDLGGFEFDLIFDPTIVTITNITIGNFLSSSGNNVMALGPRGIGNGHLVFGGFGYGMNNGSSGNGTLATLELVTLGGTTTTLRLEDMQLVNSDATRIPLHLVGEGHIRAGWQIYLPLVLRNY
jgi:hypothetical protein